MRNHWIIGLLSITLLGTPSIYGDPQEMSQMEIDSLQRDIQAKECEIESLGNLRDYYVAKSTRLKNRADRYQFQNNNSNLVEARRLYKQAQEADCTVQKIDEEIERREMEKEELEKQLPAPMTE